MEVNLPPRLAQYAEAQVKAGRYSSTDEVIADALRRLREANTELDGSDNGLVREALNLATATQRDALAMLQSATSGGDIRHDLATHTNSIVSNTLDFMRQIGRAHV